MKLFSVRGIAQKLDDGALCGNAPLAQWPRCNPCAAQNRIHFECR
ncbi:hypothetical protein [Reinekea sp.]|nr:hypothetical protein [Reinekea sp.]